MPRQKGNIPEDETSEARFKRVSEHRAKQAIRYIRMLKNMPKQPSYSFSTEDVEKLKNALDKEYLELSETLQKAIDGTLGAKSKDIPNIF